MELKAFFKIGSGFDVTSPYGIVIRVHLLQYAPNMGKLFCLETGNRLEDMTVSLSDGQACERELRKLAELSNLKRMVYVDDAGDEIYQIF
jgi:hypothetical protein